MEASIHNLKDERPQCLDEIVELWSQNALETAACELAEQEKKEVRKQLEQYVQTAFGAVLTVKDENSQTIGYGLASIKQDLVSHMLYGQIDEIYIAPPYRRLKIGKRLAGHLINWLNGQGVSYVNVYVDPDNKTALRFWEGIGLSREFYILTN
ncbi:MULTISPECIES: GNAT family N-acetyltransferase [unclassified Bacillus (in: firmicutes)]|uniref:GNAT family N-acetyltransferase n=1 Tax=unclassified Bacillus (in: firmicutes) TaxID=185979 RepID=UPI000415A1D8|nr:MULTISPECIES: GNAT family N-acetyltransferase [unclassified Bacillus (in: firmicutes)]QHZ48444.1 GNAT family N-acetyltransferase [Bacillus sp. NSP9.1]WFA05910.1 GNAT family N-acetyltransferase [Bacillus sp. HSf4]